MRTVAALGAAVILVACSQTGQSSSDQASPTTASVTQTPGHIRPSADPGASNDDQWQDAAALGGTGGKPDSSGAAECARTAAVPLTARPLTGDPEAELKTGKAASALGIHIPLDKVTEFRDFASYRDPSTPTDLAGLVATWKRDGFSGGVVAEHEAGSVLVVASVVQFASASAGRDATSAHLRDLCHGAVNSRPLQDGTGMTLLRESGAARTVWARGSDELSLFVCHCVGADDAERMDRLDRWRTYLESQWGGVGTRPDAAGTKAT